MQIDVLKLSVLSAAFMLLSSVQASNLADLHGKLKAGKRARKADLLLVEKEVSEHPGDPFNSLVAGESYASRGFHALAAEHFERADLLKKDYVLSHFKNGFESEIHIPPLLFSYLIEKSPADPALLYYLARRNLILLPDLKESIKAKALLTAKHALNKAISQTKPWPGTHAMLAMLYYNQGSFKKARLLVQQELQFNCKQPLALKLKVLLLQKQGLKIRDLSAEIKTALSVSDLDPELNLLMARSFFGQNDLASAEAYALKGMLAAHDRNTLNEARNQISKLAKNRNCDGLVQKTDLLLSDYLSRDSELKRARAALFRIRMAECFLYCKKPKELHSELKKAIELPSAYRAYAAFCLGRQLSYEHDYKNSLVYLDLACRLNRNPKEQRKYRAYRDRIHDVSRNLKRDLALKLKMLF